MAEVFFGLFYRKLKSVLPIVACSVRLFISLLLDGHSEERPSSAQPYLGGCYWTGSE